MENFHIFSFPLEVTFPWFSSGGDLAPYGVYEDIFSPCNLGGDVFYPGIWLNILQCTGIAPIAKNDPNPNIKVEKFCSTWHTLFLLGLHWALWPSPNGGECTWGEIGLIIWEQNNMGTKSCSITKIILVCNESWSLFRTCHLHSLCWSFAILFHLNLLSPIWGMPCYRFISDRATEAHGGWIFFG